MILSKVLRNMFNGESVQQVAPPDAAGKNSPRVLNVGGNSKQIPIPAHYAGWAHVLLDIDPGGNPDVVCDARELLSLEENQFDAVYCSHNLEHYYRHDGAKVLRGFLHVLKPQGFAEIRVPDISSVMRHVVASGIDIDDTLYVSPSGPITVGDVIYGWGKQIEESGVDFFAHKTGFSPATLARVLDEAGFGKVYIQVREEAFEVSSLAFKTQPSESSRALLGIEA
jgi:SAM-dependent methyltransferase